MNSKQRQFDALVRSLSGDLFRYAYWLCGDEALANDLVQETFLRAWRALGDLRDTAAAKAWLITILRREHARLYERKTPQFSDVSEIDINPMLVFEHGQGARVVDCLIIPSTNGDR